MKSPFLPHLSFGLIRNFAVVSDLAEPQMKLLFLSYSFPLSETKHSAMLGTI